jgi:hypothetical protein
MSYALFGFGQEGEAEGPGVPAQDCMDRGGTPLADGWCAFCPPNETFYISLDECGCAPGYTRDPDTGVCQLKLATEEEPSAETPTPVVTPAEPVPSPAPIMVQTPGGVIEMPLSPGPMPTGPMPSPMPSPVPGPAPVTPMAPVTAAAMAEKPTPWLLYGAIGAGVLLLAALATGAGATSNPRRRRRTKRCPVGMKAQTLVFDKDYFNRYAAKAWARRYGYRSTKVDETRDSYRIRQRSAREFTSGSLRTISFRPGVKSVLGCPR